MSNLTIIPADSSAKEQLVLPLFDTRLLVLETPSQLWLLLHNSTLGMFWLTCFNTRVKAAQRKYGRGSEEIKVFFNVHLKIYIAINTIAGAFIIIMAAFQSIHAHKHYKY